MGVIHTSKDGPVAILQCTKEISHTIDDTASNTVEPGLLTIEGGEIGKALKITLHNGDVVTFSSIDAATVNARNFQVIKVWDTGTTFTSSYIKIFG